MKKFYALLMAGVVMAAMVFPAVAAPSPEGTTLSPEATPITSTTQVSAEANTVINSYSTVSVNVAGATATALSSTMANSVINVTSNETHLANLGIPTNAKLVAAVDVSYSGEIPAGGVQIPFKVSGAKAGDLVYVVHRQSTEPYQWEVVGQAVLGDDLTVVGTFTSFSPVGFLVVDSANVDAAAVKAPKTGEF